MTTDDTSSGSTTPPVDDEVATSLSLDTVFEILADRRRRFSLYAFVAAPIEALEFSDLVEEVTTLEAAVDDGPLTQEQYLDAAADLYHWHLPVLAEVGVVEYDERSGTVRYLARPLLEEWVSRVKRDELDIANWA